MEFPVQNINRGKKTERGGAILNCLLRSRVALLLTLLEKLGPDCSRVLINGKTEATLGYYRFVTLLGDVIFGENEKKSVTSERVGPNP